MCTSANLLLYPNRSIGKILCDVIGYALKTRRSYGNFAQNTCEEFLSANVVALVIGFRLQFHSG